MPAALFISSQGDSFLPGRSISEPFPQLFSRWAASPPGRSPNPLLLRSPTGKPTGGRLRHGRQVSRPGCQAAERPPSPGAPSLAGPNAAPKPPRGREGRLGPRVRGGRRPGRRRPCVQTQRSGRAAVYSDHTPPPSSDCRGARGRAARSVRPLMAGDPQERACSAAKDGHEALPAVLLILLYFWLIIKSGEAGADAGFVYARSAWGTACLWGSR